MEPQRLQSLLQDESYIVYIYTENDKPISAAAGMVPIIPTFSYTLKFKQ